MFLSEIPDETDVTILVKIGKERLEFHTKTIKLDNAKEVREFAKVQKDLRIPVRLIEPLRNNEGRIIGFSKGVQGVSYEVTIVHEGKLYVWNAITIRHIRFSDQRDCHLLCSEQNVMASNRRDNYRLWLGIDCVVQIGMNRSAVDATVKDISANGIGIIVKPNTVGKVGDLVNISFHDEETETNFRLSAMIMRIVELDEEIEDASRRRKLYGCKLNLSGMALKTNSHPVIQKYINMKQQAKLKSRK